MRKTILLVILSSLLIGCSYLKPYRLDIQQGNVIDQTQVAKLNLGMSKNEVLNLLGTPVLNSTFDENAWDYTYTNQINGGKITKKSLILEFSGDKLKKINK